MAEKRMFSKKVTTSDEFITMPASSQILYIHLNLEADDEGFVNGVKRTMRAINASEDDLKLLLFKNFLIIFDSGVVVITHWKTHNTIRNDRFKSSDFLDEKSQLFLNENGVYTKCQPSANQLTTIGIHRIEENRIEENRIEENRTKNQKVSIDRSNNAEVNKDDSKNDYLKYGKFKNVHLTTDQYETLQTKGLVNYIDSLSTYMKEKGKFYDNHFLTIINWNDNSKRKEQYGKVRNKESEQFVIRPKIII